VIDEAGLVHLVGVRFRAGGAWPFLGVPLKEFADEVVELEAILGIEMRELRERLGAASTDDERFDLLEGWLWRRFRRHTPPTRAVSHALTMIRTRSSEARITRLAGEIGISHKHLLREFDRCVGLRPKAFARICAFQRVIQWVGWKREIDWADAAVRCGYYDQAHLIREFRSFSGLTPGSYLARRGPFLNYLEV
jgi:AraC-like DNA-binding protein